MPPWSLQQSVTVTLTQQQHKAQTHGTARSCRQSEAGVSPSPGGLRWPPGAQVHTRRQLQYGDYTLPDYATARDPRSRLSDRAAQQHTL